MLSLNPTPQCASAWAARLAAITPLAKYLPYAPEVVHAVRGRGVLVGLPLNHFTEEPRAEVYYTGAPDEPECEGVNDVTMDGGKLKLVLWAPEDLPAILHLLPQEVQEQVGGLSSPFKREEAVASVLRWIQNWAARIDLLRSAGIALNMPADSYVRRVVPAPSLNS